MCGIVVSVPPVKSVTTASGGFQHSTGIGNCSAANDDDGDDGGGGGDDGDGGEDGAEEDVLLCVYIGKAHDQEVWDYALENIADELEHYQNPITNTFVRNENLQGRKSKNAEYKKVVGVCTTCYGRTIGK